MSNYVNTFFTILRESSETDNFMEEWELFEIYDSDDVDHCICGHEIMEICVIKNKINGTTLNVGNCCINKFKLNVDGWSKSLLTGLKRIKNDITKSANKSLVAFVYHKKFITAWEALFLNDISRKRNLTEKQRNKKIELNKKILEKMK